MTNTRRAQDAANRTWRTTLQGVAAVVTVGLLGGVLQWLRGGDLSLHTLEVSAGTAALTAVYSWLHRTILDPSGIPSALPPAQPGPPVSVDPAP